MSYILSFFTSNFFKIYEKSLDFYDFFKKKRNFIHYRNFSTKYYKFKSDLMNFGYAEISDSGISDKLFIPQQENTHIFQIQLYDQAYNLGNKI